jgi:tetratricopeptide (TPR) repeat protein
MPINAERSIRKALEKEGADKPSMDFLASVLVQTGRGHEVPALWKERVESIPDEPAFQAKYAYALMQQGQTEEGEKVFEKALSTLQDTFAVKRYYAPVLAEKGELDRAMDFYEDCLDVTPTDVTLMMEYAKTLEKAGRDFEIPPVLRNVMAANPDPSVRSQVAGWLIELEQPKRVEAVEEAGRKVELGDFEGALRELKPLKNWMGDYWKYWAILANCLNHIGEYVEAEDAAGRLVNLMPGYEQGYSELMRALSGQEKYDQAYRAMKWAAMNMPQSLPIHLNFGLAAKQAGFVDEARALAKQIREALGANAEFEPVLAEMEK